MTLVGQGLIPNWRLLTADDLGIGVEAHATGGYGSTAPDSPVLTSQHPQVQEATRLARIFGGVIFTGPPGTSKSYLAAETARLIADGDDRRMWFVQFHASYGYEDFVFGYRPSPTGFEPLPGPLLQAVNAARDDAAKRPYVLVIDELSRSDVGRVFGEALTYIERSKREKHFQIASGETIWIPKNLVILATMNPLDRGVDEVDAAFERRFAKMRMDPDVQKLTDILSDNNVDPDLMEKIANWFKRINGQSRVNPSAAVGHAYFVDVLDRDSLNDLWEYQLQFLVERAFRLDRQSHDSIVRAWQQIFDLVPEERTSEEPASEGPA